METQEKDKGWRATLRRAADAGAKSREALLDAIAEADGQEDCDGEWHTAMYGALGELENYEKANPQGAAMIDEAVAWLAAVGDELCAGRLCAERVAQAVKALGYDRAVEEAGREGELRGRNDALRLHLDEAFGSGDAMPSLCGGTAPQAPGRRQSIFDLAAQA